MTTPDNREKKPEGGRTEPQRNGTGGVSGATERAVKSGYQAVAANIVQARIAAERFRQGAYNVSDVPADLAKMSGRMPDVINDFSSAGIEILQWLIKAAGPAAAATAAGDLRLRMDFKGDGAARATALTNMLARPTTDAEAGAVSCASLGSGPDGKGAIGPVSFSYNLSTGALVGAVAIPRDLEAGVYSGLVYASGQRAPLGVLSVEVKNAPADATSAEVKNSK